MTKNMRISILSVLLSCCHIIAPAQHIDKDKIDRYFQALEDNNKFMGSVSVFRDKSEIYSKSVGFTDIDKNMVANNSSEYHIGSISKTFTAVMIFQAVDEGKLSLSESIDKFFPSIGNGHKITVAHLLGHRSGIHNFTDDEAYPNWHTQDKTKEQMVDIIAKGGSDFEPGSQNRYSNSNYVLLSYILECIDKKPYAEILTDRITKPLSLSHTYLGRNTVVPEHNECNSYKYFDKWRIEPLTNPSITLGAGGIVSTPEDLNRFANALFGGNLISAHSLSIMQTIKDNYGMGLFPIPFYTKQGFGHNGGIDGFHSMLIYFPEDKLSYAITSNALNYNLTQVSDLEFKPFEHTL